MRFFLKSIFINLTSLALVSFLFPGLSYGGDVKILLLASLVFSVINFFIKPIIKLFLLPINLITLGMLGWLTGVLCLLILTIIVPQIELKPFQFNGANFAGFIIPSFYFTALLSLIGASFLISGIYNFLSWLTKK